ncbi:TVP38/TMEM64 family protein [Hespellia stercorisuis]|uniref:TVP38/TMEM64 family membrane protein n=1 Tax=Hespellia stercorisuis DSM 15480 TaxID=1121950 RepID=A0A1M6I835_9FIRM|nr:TVP38/TMEM64 family protein [Hespellia stercorisuis]SHJ30630.1 Uncharacterized membrane protein YdjX, TVP38/TMEM64 family, SNARE-associated domain [Hespellia stercorisuis DSM 15480]
MRKSFFRNWYQDKIKNKVKKRMVPLDKIMNAGLLAGMLFLLAFVYYGYRKGIFSSTEAFESYIAGFGVWEAVVFILIQIIQVVVPVLPSSIGCVAGILLFGPWTGFLYNYIAICTGSVINFLLSRRYGVVFAEKIVGEKRFEKYIHMTEDRNNFEKVFIAAIFAPGAPDDFLCYIAGLTKMKLKKFVLVILLGKPLSIAIFSLGTSAVIKFIISLLK